MEKIYAFLDESGEYGFKDSVLEQKHLFIVAAVVVKESDIAMIEDTLQGISEKDFSGSEIKSSNIGGKHKRRVRILGKVLPLPFNILCFVVDKRAIFSEHGVRRNKKYFYEFLNNLVYKELRSAYPMLGIVTDEVGDSDFTREFSKYVQSHRKPITLFDQEDFDVVNSKNSRLVQLADLMAGTISYIYEEKKNKTVPQDINYLRMIEKKLLRVKFFPKSYDDSLFEHTEGDDNYCREIAQVAYRRAEQFIQENQDSTDGNIQRQVFTLNYLLFRFKYNSFRRYISTKELMNALQRANYGSMSEQAFRSKVIGSLRDRGVIISSSPKGYKLPSSEKEIIDYFQHVNTVVLPMVHRLALCNEFLRLGSSDNIDYLRKNGFNGLRVIVDAIRQNEHTS